MRDENKKFLYKEIFVLFSVKNRALSLVNTLVVSVP